MIALPHPQSGTHNSLNHRSNASGRDLRIEQSQRKPRSRDPRRHIQYLPPGASQFRYKSCPVSSSAINIIYDVPTLGRSVLLSLRASALPAPTRNGEMRRAEMSREHACSGQRRSQHYRIRRAQPLHKPVITDSDPTATLLPLNMRFAGCCGRCPGACKLQLVGLSRAWLTGQRVCKQTSETAICAVP